MTLNAHAGSKLDQKYVGRLAGASQEMCLSLEQRFCTGTFTRLSDLLIE